MFFSTLDQFNITIIFLDNFFLEKFLFLKTVCFNNYYFFGEVFFFFEKFYIYMYIWDLNVDTNNGVLRQLIRTGTMTVFIYALVVIEGLNYIISLYPKTGLVFGFSDSVTSLVENIIELHHFIFFFVLLISGLVLWVLLRIIDDFIILNKVKFKLNKNLQNHVFSKLYIYTSGDSNIEDSGKVLQSSGLGIYGLLLTISFSVLHYIPGYIPGMSIFVEIFGILDMCGIHVSDIFRWFCSSPESTATESTTAVVDSTTTVVVDSVVKEETIKLAHPQGKYNNYQKVNILLEWDNTEIKNAEPFGDDSVLVETKNETPEPFGDVVNSSDMEDDDYMGFLIRLNPLVGGGRES